MKKWYRVEAYNERTDFWGKNRVAFDFCADLNDWSDVRTCREVAGNKLQTTKDIVIIFKPI